MLPATVAAVYVNKKEKQKSLALALPVQNNNYFLSVCENKEVGRLVSILSSSTNSMKKVFILLCFLALEYLRRSRLILCDNDYLWSYRNHFNANHLCMVR